MSVLDCAKIVKDGDEDRFLSLMAAMPIMRVVLFPLYAFNTEVTKAAWASNEPLLCQMRLQYLRDLVVAIFAGDTLPNIPLAKPLADVVQNGGVPQQQLLELIDARHWDIERAGFENAAHFSRFLDHTAGNLMVMAARATGVADDFADAVRAHGSGMGLANFLIAVPDLKAHGRVPLLDETPDAVAELASQALQRIKDADRQKIPSGQVALRAGWDTQRVLKLVSRHPERVLEGRLQTSPFRRKTSLLWMSMFG